MDSTNYDDILQDYFFSKTLRPATEWSYRKVVNSFRRYTGDKVSPGQVNRLTVLNWRRHVLSEQGLSSITWNNKVAHMRAIYNHALLQEFISLKDNPFNGVIARPDIKREKNAHSDRDKKNLFAAGSEGKRGKLRCDWKVSLSSATSLVLAQCGRYASLHGNETESAAQYSS